MITSMKKSAGLLCGSHTKPVEKSKSNSENTCDPSVMSAQMKHKVRGRRWEDGPTGEWDGLLRPSVLCCPMIMCGAKFFSQSQSASVQNQSSREMTYESQSKRFISDLIYLFPRSTSLLDLPGLGTQTRHWTARIRCQRF